jgi:hypothetical protein
MLLAIRAVLGFIPDYPHQPSIGQRPTKSMAYDVGRKFDQILREAEPAYVAA